MKSRMTTGTVLVCMLLMTCIAMANNVQVSNASLTGQNVSSQYVMVQFDLSWENSWRNNTNWDAVWLFVKYRTADGTWGHATLNSTPANHSVGSAAAAISQADGIGAFYYRSATGAGSFSSTGVQLRWEYGVDGVGASLSEEILSIKVFAIEMVYVPQGPFYAGGGYGVGQIFFDGMVSLGPWSILSENAITTVSTGDGPGLYVYRKSQAFVNSDEVGGFTIPAAFPKGYNAFYCMKYEITQQQYVDFLNTLNPDEQNYRYFLTVTPINFLQPGSVAINRAFPNRLGINLLYKGHTPSRYAATYACNLNPDVAMNEIDDGQNVACNYLSWWDASAYTDWAGLRPMTELEYEKACRGPIYPASGCFAWGTWLKKESSELINHGRPDEVPISDDVNFPTTIPFRVGMCASANTNREQSGASYYGIMDLSTNLSESCIVVGNPVGRYFTGVHGDGNLGVNMGYTGLHNVATWPAPSARCLGMVSRDGLVSTRYYIYDGTPNMEYDKLPVTGYRCVRTAP